MKKMAMAALAAATMLIGASAGAQTYVGSWEVDQGPFWGTQPLAYTGQQAAALLFGGNASDYAISTVSSDPTLINYSAWYSVLGAYGPNDGGFLFAENYVSTASSQAPGYYYSGNSFPFSPTDAASAYVSDNAGPGNVNYAFRITAVPEPATWAMMLVGFGMVGFGLRRRAKQQVRVTYA